MKKKLFLSFLLTFLVALCIVLASCGLFGGGSSGKEAKLIKVGSALPDDGEVFLVVDHETWYLSGNVVEISESASWKLYYDEACLDEITDRRFAGKGGTLSNGNNVFYIQVVSGDQQTTNTYKLTIYKSFYVMVDYYDGDTFLTNEMAYTGVKFIPTYSPEYVGYTFNGWLDSENKVFSSGIVWGEMNLYVSKTPNTYKATLNANGGKALQNTEAFIRYDSDFTLPITERFGYNFVGWYAGDTQVTDSKGKALDVWNFDEDTVLTARWTPIQYVLTLIVNDNSAGYAYGGGFVDYGSAASIKAIPKGSYTFVGWYDENDELITQNAEYEFEMDTDRTLTAKFSLFTLTIRSEDGGAVSPMYSVAFDLNGGEGTTPDTQYVSGFAALYYPTTTPTRKGYLFRGWYTEPKPDYGVAPYDFAAPVESDITLYAVWYSLPKAYENNVMTEGLLKTYVNLYGTSSSNRVYIFFYAHASGTYTLKYLSDKVDITGGVSFEVYNRTSPNADTVLLRDSYNDRDTEHSKTIDVTAGNVYCIEVWRINNFSEDYYFSIGYSSNGAKTRDGGIAASFTRETPTRAGTVYTLVADANLGYEFLGWYDEAGELVSSEMIFEYTMPYSSKTLTAKWQCIS